MVMVVFWVVAVATMYATSYDLSPASKVRSYFQPESICTCSRGPVGAPLPRRRKRRAAATVSRTLPGRFFPPEGSKSR
jgi:hypothetical protein